MLLPGSSSSGPSISAASPGRPANSCASVVSASSGYTRPARTAGIGAVSVPAWRYVRAGASAASCANARLAASTVNSSRDRHGAVTGGWASSRSNTAGGRVNPIGNRGSSSSIPSLRAIGGLLLINLPDDFRERIGAPVVELSAVDPLDHVVPVVDMGADVQVLQDCQRPGMTAQN